MPGGSRAFMQTPEYKLKMSLLMKGKKKPPFTAEHRANLSKAFTGRVASTETRKKMSESQKIAQNKPERKEQIRRQLTGSKNYQWKGDNVSYGSLHKWVARNLGRPMQCAECKLKSTNPYNIQWANISHEYKRDLLDWVRLCAKCHKAYDTNRLILESLR